MARTQLLTVIHEIVAAAGVLEAFDTAPHFSLRIDNPPYMPLVIEAFRAPDALTPGHTRSISIAHYREECGDLVADPEILMTGVGELLWLQMPGVFTEIRFRGDDGRVRCAVWHAADVRELANTWARNIRAQGFIAAARRLRTVQGSV